VCAGRDLRERAADFGEKLLQKLLVRLQVLPHVLLQGREALAYSVDLVVWRVFVKATGKNVRRGPTPGAGVDATVARACVHALSARLHHVHWHVRVYVQDMRACVYCTHAALYIGCI